PAGRHGGGGGARALAGGARGLAVIRPAAVAALRRWNEVLTGAALVIAGVWLFLRGGWFFGTLGVLAGMAGTGWAVTGIRRMRFRQGGGQGAGVVDLLEGQITYLGPAVEGMAGGFVSV